MFPDDTFDETIKAYPGLWIIVVHAPWCSARLCLPAGRVELKLSSWIIKGVGSARCQQLMPTWKKLAEELREQHDVFVAKASSFGLKVLPGMFAAKASMSVAKAKSVAHAHLRAYINGDRERVLLQRFRADAFPTIYVLSGSNAWKYEGNRNLESV
eukprot:1157462-Pelagomonas_calceolata.AAC.1